MTDTTPTSSCAINTISLIPGQSFILPPGSTIIGSSNVNSIQSACADLTKVEQSDCYVFMLGGFENNYSGASQYGDRGSETIRGFIFNNKYTSFNTPIINNEVFGGFDMADLVNQLSTNVQGFLSTATGYKRSTGGSGEKNTMSILVIKTFPSIASTLQLLITSDAPVGSLGGAVTYRVALIARSEVVASGYEDIPNCP